jgi:hypothetical protein
MMGEMNHVGDDAGDAAKLFEIHVSLIDFYCSVGSWVKTCGIVDVPPCR